MMPLVKTIACRLGLLLALASCSPAQPFRVGEVLDYDVRYLKVMKGTARLVVAAETTHQGVSAYRLTQDMAVGSFFTNQVEILCRQGDLFPLLITTVMTREGREARGQQVYDPDQHTATFSQTADGRTKSKTVRRRHPIQDLVTVPYYARTLPLSVGAVFPLSLWEGEYTLRVAGREKLSGDLAWAGDTSLGWVLKSDPPILKAWLTGDERRLPVKVEMEGKLRMRLTLRAVTEPSAPSTP
jgi:Protein of unknown function (DUF3108)